MKIARASWRRKPTTEKKESQETGKDGERERKSERMP